MIPQPITINGRTGTVVYLDADWHPVSSEHALMAKVVFEDGGTAFFTTRQSSAEKEPGVGGITRKFDEAKHPRGKDGRFKEATEPRIFSRPSDVGSYTSWGETKWGWLPTQEEIEKFGYTPGQPTGRLLTGEPIPREQIPETLYHVTTNAPAVESSGVLLGLLESGGLGGGQAQGVSFTSSKEDAVVIQRELRRAVLIARGDVDFDVLEQWARQDELMAGLPEGALNPVLKEVTQFVEGNRHSLEHTFVWDKKLPDEQRGWVGPITPEERERKRRSLLKDALNSYLMSRERVASEAAGKPVPTLKNPILFGRQEQLAKLDPENIQILETSREDIPAEALVTTGSDKFLHEVRVYADVPRRRLQSIAKYDPQQVRHPEGSSEGGRFAETGRSGKATSDPALAAQAKTGIAAVEKLLPKAISKADFSSVPGAWGDLSGESQEQVRQFHENLTYDEIDIQAIDADLTVDVRWNLKEGATLETAKKVAEKTKVWVEGDLADEPLDQFALDKSVSGGKPLDFKTLSVPDPLKLTDAGYPVLDLKALRHTDGTELTPLERDHVRGIWKHQYEKVIEDEIEIAQDSDEYLAKREQMVLAEVKKRWERLSDTEKMSVASGMTGITFTFGAAAHLEPKQWVTGVEEGEHTDADYARTHAIALKLAELRTDELRKERGLLEPGAKPSYYIVEQHAFLDRPAGFAAKDSAGVIIAVSSSKEIVEENAELWATEMQQSRGSISSKQLIQHVWTSWKQKSSEGFGLSLQLAAAREFGGFHRMIPEEVQEAERAALDYGGIETLQAYARAQWEVTQMVMSKAGENQVAVYRGLMLPGEKVDATTNVQSDVAGEPVPPIPPPTKITSFQGEVLQNPREVTEWVSFEYHGKYFETRRRVLSILEVEWHQWEDVDKATQQKVLEAWKDPTDLDIKGMSDAEKTKMAEDLFHRMSGTAKLDLYEQFVKQGKIPERQVQRTYESIEQAIEREISGYQLTRARQEVDLVFTKLPDLQLQRAGAQSTTGTRDVANDWGGVGTEDIENPTRVVLRIEAPSTSVLSLPVYGQNEIGEHESVIMGTRDKWLWDAWRDRAPDFASQSISRTTRKAELQALVIDLQAEDRGKPHWMSSVNFQTVLKWDESKHRREPKGSPKGGEFTSGQGQEGPVRTDTVPTPQPHAGAGGGRGDAVPSPPAAGKARPSAAQEAHDVAQAYNAKHGFPPIQHGYVTVDEPRARSIAKAFEDLPVNDLDNPDVREAYEALGREIQAQWDHIIASGMTFEPWTKEGQPYQNSQEMIDDVRNNKHMYFFTGGEPHPSVLGEKDPKTGLSLNDKFRAVHDYFGHAAGGYGFGARGEENAWLSHSQMLSPKARRALTTETRGQNSWVNFGIQNYNPDGTYKNIPAVDRPFSEQKAALLPDMYVLMPGEKKL